jgi:hypothetical protein
MTEALAVVDSLRTASQLPILTNESSLTLNTTLTAMTDRKVLPLKMALFNLQKYIKEGDFVVEFMIKGGLRLLIALLERVSGGLTGNSLAVSELLRQIAEISTHYKVFEGSSSSNQAGRI